LPISPRQLTCKVREDRLLLPNPIISYKNRRNEDWLPGDPHENVIVLSNEFFEEVTAHPIPTDLEAVKLLSSAPAVLDLFVWLSYRCFTSKGMERIPIFGPFGLVQQLGAVEYARPRKFREKLQQWLKTIRLVWPECPAEITADGEKPENTPC